MDEISLCTVNNKDHKRRERACRDNASDVIFGKSAFVRRIQVDPKGNDPTMQIT